MAEYKIENGSLVSIETHEKSFSISDIERGISNSTEKIKEFKVILEKWQTLKSEYEKLV
jgi:hypothetical protein